MRHSLQIALTVDPYLPVPPQFYGGIERVVDWLAHGLTARGHKVTLFAHPQSSTSGTLVPYGAPPHMGAWPRLKELWQLSSKLAAHCQDFDLIHSFGRLASLIPFLPNRRLPKIQSYQRAIAWPGIEKAVRFAGSSICFTACSGSMYRQRLHDSLRQRGDWRTIFNGVDLRKYSFVPQVDANAPLAFLGRLEPIKGAHNAIAIAKAAGRRLLIAGNRVADCEDYFQRGIAPHIDGCDVQYVGPVNDPEKSRLLGSCSALLMPIEWDEPFGIVMAEAFACGTPVVGFSRGSVPEVLIDGRNGYTCRTVSEASAAVVAAASLDRAAVRRDCEQRFSAGVIVGQYENLYYERVAALSKKNRACEAVA